MLALDNTFWQFSLKVYGASGVADECLDWQRTCSLDVNILLFCAWLGAAQKMTLTANEIAAINEAVGPWHNTAVKPLRAIRQGIKARPEMAHAEVHALRRQVADSELQAEQIEQALLFDWFRALPPRESSGSPGDMMVGNIELYLTSGRADKARSEGLSYRALTEAALRFVSQSTSPNGEPLAAKAQNEKAGG